MKKLFYFLFIGLLFFSCKKKETPSDKNLNVQYVWEINQLNPGAKVAIAYGDQSGEVRDTVTSLMINRTTTLLIKESIYPQGSKIISSHGQILNDVSPNDSIKAKLYVNGVLQDQSIKAGQNEYYNVYTQYEYKWNN